MAFEDSKTNPQYVKNKKKGSAPQPELPRGDGALHYKTISLIKRLIMNQLAYTRFIRSILNYEPIYEARTSASAQYEPSSY